MSGAMWGWICLESLIWLGGILMVVSILKDASKSSSEKFLDSIFAILIFGFAEIIFSFPLTTRPIRNTVITYETPSIIAKTNNLVVVSHVVNGKVVADLRSDTASYWNSTNIMILKKSGYNIIGVNVEPTYEVVIK